jgi:GGDEF domain-containing protein
VVAERLRLSLRALELVQHGAVVPIAASFGVASSDQRPTEPLTPDGLLQAADAAMYTVKRNGRDGVRAAVVPSS